MKYVITSSSIGGCCLSSHDCISGPKEVYKLWRYHAIAVSRINVLEIWLAGLWFGHDHAGLLEMLA